MIRLKKSGRQILKSYLLFNKKSKQERKTKAIHRIGFTRNQCLVNSVKLPSKKTKIEKNSKLIEINKGWFKSAFDEIV